jgi:hypothetical protein
MKEHIYRKHPGNEIPDNVNSTSKNFTKSSLLSETPYIFPTWLKYSHYIQNLPPPILDTNSRKETRHNSFFKIIFEFLMYKNFIQNQILLQNPNFYQNNNVSNFNFLNVYYDLLSNIDFGKPLLFKIYKCSVCFRDTLFMLNGFEYIKTSSEHICCFNLSLLPKTNEENKNNIDPKFKEFSIYQILQIIDKKNRL